MNKKPPRKEAVSFNKISTPYYFNSLFHFLAFFLALLGFGKMFLQGG